MKLSTLSFAKNGHTYIFRYMPGMEDIMVDEIMRMAEDSESDLDWLDAATLSFQIAQEAAGAPPKPTKIRG